VETLPIPRQSRVILPLVVLPLFLPVATSLARTISWSGYNWDVRPAGTAQEPGPNDWSDSDANVRLHGSELLLSIVKDASGNWTSSEVDNQRHLGYGTYRWVVATDLSALDANEVLGMFTYGGSDPSKNEIDIEPSHWGDMSSPSGSATVWQNANAGLSEERDFNYSGHPPYVNQFTWSPGRIGYLITDATGATLLAWTVTTGVPTPSTEVPVINYWRYNNVAPASVRTMRISSFAWAPLGQNLPPTTNPPGKGSPSAGGPGGPAPPGSRSPGPPSSSRGGPPRQRGTQRMTCVLGVPAGATRGRSERTMHVNVWMRPSRFPIARLSHEGVLHWTATAVASVDLIIGRWVRDAGFVRMGAIRGFVRPGAGRIRLPVELAGRRLGRGTYRIGLASGPRPVRCTPGHLGFTVP
jgi:hypothetical protein